MLTNIKKTVADRYIAILELKYFKYFKSSAIGHIQFYDKKLKLWHSLALSKDEFHGFSNRFIRISQSNKALLFRSNIFEVVDISVKDIKPNNTYLRLEDLITGISKKLKALHIQNTILKNLERMRIHIIYPFLEEEKEDEDPDGIV